MAPKPSYQLLVWSVPTVAFLLTYLWYRRKRNSLRSDPGGTASVDLTALQLKRPDSCQEPVAKQSGNKFEGTQKVETEEKSSSSAAADSQNRETCASVHLCTNSETDSSVISVQKENPFKPENLTNVKDTGLVQEESFPSLQIVSPAKSEPVVLETIELEKNKESSDKVSECQEDSEEIDCKGKCEEIGKGKIEEESKSSYKSNKETSISAKTNTNCIEETTLNCEIEDSEQVRSINYVHLLSENVSEDISDKSTDILNFQQVRESDSAATPSSETVFIPDSFLSQQQAEEQLCVSSIDKCVVSNSAALSCIEDSENTVLQSTLCESCGISDSAVSKQHFQDCDKKTPVASVASTSDTVGEASCTSAATTSDSVGEASSSAATTSSTTRTIMARKSSTDLAMERSADSDATGTAHQESTTPEQGKSGAENVQVERDSANHSPADVMLGSPAISNYSDANSEGSSDSGKGCSDMATPPPRTPASGSSLTGDVPSIYEFVLPQHLVGRLIGRYGGFAHQIRDKTTANIIIKRHPDTTKLKICAIEGNQMSIERALEMIREKFPLKLYPNMTLEQVCFVPATPVFPVPQCIQLRLVEGVNNDVIVSYMVTPAHVFLQQPTHPSFLNLNTQAAFMQACYNEPTVPALPRPVAADVICVAPVMGNWCRAQVVTDEAEDGTCTIRLLDYGGYDVVDCSLLRQIRQDFMLLPFQAAEAYLANIIPAGGAEEEWRQEAFDVLEELTKGQVVEAQLAGYAENGVPFVNLYSIVRSKAICVNYELVKRGLADCTGGWAVVNGNGVSTEECDQAGVVEQ